MQTDNSIQRKVAFLLAFAVAALVANLYYMQPIVGVVAEALRMAPASAGLVITLIQAGYGVSVLMLVPLGDLMENKLLILSTMAVAILGVLGLALAESEWAFYAAAILTGVGCSSVQSIIPYVANLSPDNKRGQAVGSIMSGLMLGIMLSRPTSSFLTDKLSWHAVFFLSAGILVVLFTVLIFVLPKRTPPPQQIPYLKLIRSMPGLFFTMPILRRRSIYQGFLFCTFCIFWTASPLYLLSGDFGFTHSEVALFALVGVAGAIVAPLAGKAADNGQGQIATVGALLLCILAYIISEVFAPGSLASIIALGTSAIVLDAGVSANLVVGQRAIFSLSPGFRSRINGVHIATVFVGGAVGSSLGVWAFQTGGWHLTTIIGAAMPALALLYFFTEPKSLYASPTQGSTPLPKIGL